MPLTLPPRNLRLFDDDGFIDPTWYEYFTRFDLRGIAKAWAVITGNGTTISSSFNIASITDTGTGNLTITLEIPFASADWVPMLTVAQSNLLSGPAEVHAAVVSIAAGSVQVGKTNATPIAADPTTWFFAGFGNQ